MTPLADFAQLTRGVLAFPADINGPNRQPHPLDTVIRWADAETWRAWSAVGQAELWQLIALHLYLDPKGLRRERLLHIADREHAGKSVATLFERRLRRACEHLATGNLPSVAAEVPAKSLVRMADFAEWARVNRIPLPAHFPPTAAAGPLDDLPAAPAVQAPAPRSDSPPSGAPVATVVAPPALAAAPKARKSRALAKAPDGYMRQAELMTIVPFSPATLWRKIKSKSFPAPVYFPPRITAWKRSDIDQWRAEIAAGKGTWVKPKRGKKN